MAGGANHLAPLDLFQDDPQRLAHQTTDRPSQSGLHVIELQTSVVLGVAAVGASVFEFVGSNALLVELVSIPEPSVELVRISVWHLLTVVELVSPERVELSFPG